MAATLNLDPVETFSDLWCANLILDPTRSLLKGPGRSSLWHCHNQVFSKISEFEQTARNLETQT